MELLQHQQQLQLCRRCPGMSGPPVVGQPVNRRVLLVGQAPGDKEPLLARPFAWTAGKTLFKWLGSTCGRNEEELRKCIYFSAVCRCFPGKKPQGGDRVPDAVEIENCSHWLNQELELLRPDLVLAVGKLSISQFLAPNELSTMIGKVYRVQRFGRTFDLIPLPHPSGASTWHVREPGKSLLTTALQLLANHPVWISATNQEPLHHKPELQHHLEV